MSGSLGCEVALADLAHTVKFTDAASGLQLDLNVNDRFGLANSALLRAYAELRPALVRPLMFAVKTWAKRRALNDPAGTDGAASFSSYALALLVIQYLQSMGDLPNLQSKELLASLGTAKERLFKDNRNKARPARGRAKSAAARPAPAPLEEIPYDCTFAVISEPSELAPYRVDAADPRERDAALGAAWTGFAKWLKALDGKIVSVAKGEPLLRRKPLQGTKKVDAAEQGQAAPAEEVAQEEAEDEEEQDRVVTLENFIEPKNWQQRPFIVQGEPRPVGAHLPQLTPQARAQTPSSWIATARAASCPSCSRSVWRRSSSASRTSPPRRSTPLQS